jgi:hypothetical protein
MEEEEGLDGGESAEEGATVDTVSATLEVESRGGGVSRLALRLARARRVTLHVMWQAVQGAKVRVTDAKGEATEASCIATEDFLGRAVAACELPMLVGRVRVEWTTAPRQAIADHD